MLACKVCKLMIFFVYSFVVGPIDRGGGAGPSNQRVDVPALLLPSSLAYLGDGNRINRFLLLLGLLFVSTECNLQVAPVRSNGCSNLR